MNHVGMQGARQSARVLVLTVNYRTAQLTIRCLRSLEPEIEAQSWIEIQVVVVENDSGDGGEIERAIRENGWSSWASLMLAKRNGGFAIGKPGQTEFLARTDSTPSGI